MIIVQKAGIQCSIQDRGRFGYRNLGVPVSGYMDDQSAIYANLILQNKKNDAVLEIGILGPTLLFEKSTLVVLTGAPKKATLNGITISYNSIIQIKKGDILSVKSGDKGVWSYLGVKGGFTNKKVLGSRASYLKANIGYPILSVNDRLPIVQHENSVSAMTNSKIHVPSFKTIEKIRVSQGLEFNRLSRIQQKLVLSSKFSIGQQSDRMAYILVGNENLLKGQKGILTSIVSPGTVQLPASGTPMLLMKDCQTTGGYARILHVVKEDLFKIAQIRAGENVGFELVNY